MIRLAFVCVLMPIAALCQESMSIDQRAGKCSVNLVGSGNTASLVCTGVDRKVAEQVKALLDQSRENKQMAVEISQKLDRILEEQHRFAVESDAAEKASASGLKELSEIARSSVDHTDASNRILTRAYVDVVAQQLLMPIENRRGLSLSISYQNSGRSPALEFRSSAELRLTPYPLTTMTAVPVSGESRTLGSGAITTSVAATTGISPLMYDWLENGSYAIVLLAAAEYHDIYGEVHVIRTCSYWHAAFRVALPQPTMLGSCPAGVFQEQRR